jgi:asparagine synthase (glutamine-hydrolysing)
MKRFNGMWAFVLLDAKNQCVIFSRDRFGIKPLYYTIRNNSIYFSSEIKGLLAISLIHYEPNQKIVAKYLLTGLVDDTEETFFNEIFQFPSSNWAKVSLKDDILSMKPEPYWTFPIATYEGTEEEAIKEFRDLFLDSLRIHTQSDVPVGTCLSGGLDSSSIVCASELLRRSHKLPNYSHAVFGYCSSDERYSEKKYMDDVVRATSAQMNYIEISQNQFLSRLPQIILEQDEPFGSTSIVSQWFVFQKAKEEGMTVMLDGQGADEILAGYHSYFITIALNLLEKREILAYLSLRSKYEKEIGNFPLSYRFLSLGAMVLLVPQPLLGVMQPAIRFLRELNRSNPLSPERISLTNALIKQYSLKERVPKTFRSLNDELKIQVKSISLPALLRYEDRNSMAHSIEARVPFLDYRLVEFLFTLPERWKIKGVTTKHILREAMKRILPESVRTRKDKIGFKATPDLTFKFARDHYSTLVDNQTEFEKKWFNPKGVRKLLNINDQSASFEFLLWRIVNMKFWLRQHWNGGPL